MDDGFVVAKTLKTEHFTVFLAAGVDEATLVRLLDIGPDHRVVAGLSLKEEAFLPESLGSLLDALFIWARSVLDMNLYSYRGNIKVAASEADVTAVFKKLYGGREGYSSKSFYISELNTIYIAAEDFTKQILGHEIAHAIISNYFVVQPPEKVTEVLAGYVEYQLRKTSR